MSDLQSQPIGVEADKAATGDANKEMATEARPPPTELELGGREPRCPGDRGPKCKGRTGEIPGVGQCHGVVEHDRVQSRMPVVQRNPALIKRSCLRRVFPGAPQQFPYIHFVTPRV